MFFTVHLSLVIVALCSIAVNVRSLEVQYCTEKYAGVPLPDYVNVIGCTEPPCPLVRGATADANITFTAPYDLPEAIIAITAIIDSIDVDFLPPDNNVCHFLWDGVCPLEKGQQITYHLELPVQKYYPEISMTLRFRFVDPQNATFTCFELPCVVVDEYRGVPLLSDI